MKNILAFLLLLSLPAVCRGESGFYFHGSSTTAIGDLAVSSRVVFSDGSTLNSVFQTQAVSSSAIVSAYSTTATTGFNCITGSTLTITTAYPRSFLITFDGTMANSTGGRVRLTPVINGQPPNIPGLHDYKEMDTSPGNNFNPSFMFVTPQMPAGTYTFCAAVWASGGTTSIPANYPCQFSAIGH